MKKSKNESDRMAELNADDARHMVALLFAGKDPVYEWGRKKAIADFKAGKDIIDAIHLQNQKESNDKEFYEAYFQTACLLHAYSQTLEETWVPISPEELLDITLARLNIPDNMAASVCGVSPETLAAYLSGAERIPLKLWHSLMYFEALMFKYKGLKSGEKVTLEWAERFLRDAKRRHNHFATPKDRHNEK